MSSDAVFWYDFEMLERKGGGHEHDHDHSIVVRLLPTAPCSQAGVGGLLRIVDRSTFRSGNIVA
jgi:hypothetical protein